MFATKPLSAPVPEPPPPTPTRTFYIPISQPLPVTPTSSPAPVSPSLLQPFAIVVLTLVATFIVLAALRVYKHTSVRLPPIPLLNLCHFDHLTSDDLADVKDWSKDDLCRLVGFLFAKLSDASNTNVRPAPATVAEPQPLADDSIANDRPLSTTEVEMMKPPVSRNPSTFPPSEHTQRRSRRASTSAPAEATPSTPPPPPPATSDSEFNLLPEPNHAPLLLSKLLYIAYAFQRLENIFGIPSFDSETAALTAKCDYRTFSQLVGPRLAFVGDRITLQLMHLEGRNKLVSDLADARIKHDVLRDEYDNVTREYADLVASCPTQTESRDPGSLRSCYPFVLLGVVLVCYVQFYLDV
ncbi:hypothetical protein FRB95_003213 [Tulasnella sp. JGI-2019a]|nr:hypothetical protein FRB95_003213 [Tulasnella sp. JGI-2019a]